MHACLRPRFGRRGRLLAVHSHCRAVCQRHHLARVMRRCAPRLLNTQPISVTAVCFTHALVQAVRQSTALVLSASEYTGGRLLTGLLLGGARPTVVATVELELHMHARSLLQEYAHTHCKRICARRAEPRCTSTWRDAVQVLRKQARG